MHVEQKSYAQVLIVNKNDFIFSSAYKAYESACPFMCFPGVCAKDFSTSLKDPKAITPGKDVILLLESYWNDLDSDEKKAVLDHELGHITNGDLKKLAEKLAKNPFFRSSVDFNEERKADQYSVELNGAKAMYNGLQKALNVILAPLQAKGMRVTLKDVAANDPIIAKRLEILKEASASQKVHPEQ
jgi:hypothetical protein